VVKPFSQPAREDRLKRGDEWGIFPLCVCRYNEETAARSVSARPMGNSMAIKSSRSQSTYRTHSLRFPVAVIFILTIFALAVNRMFQEPQLFPWSQLDWLCFGGGYLGLVLAEMLEGKVYPRRLIFPVRLLLLGVRLIFILSIYWVDGGKTSLPIFSVFLYALYFHLGAVPTLLALAANIWALYVWSPVLHVNLGEQVAYTSILVLFASQIQHDDRIRMRNQESVSYTHLTLPTN
jgi:hypothetical protein